MLDVTVVAAIVTVLGTLVAFLMRSHTKLIDKSSQGFHTLHKDFLGLSKVVEKLVRAVNTLAGKKERPPRKKKRPAAKAPRPRKKK